MKQLIFPKQTLHGAVLSGQTVLLRTDYNVPITRGQIGDDWRLRASLPTIRYLLERRCKVIIISHLGRPNGQPSPKYSLTPVAAKLADLLGRPVHFVDDCLSPRLPVAVKKLPVGEVLLLENLRFCREEELNDADFARQLVKLSTAELFVQDGFGVVHRRHASTDAITNYLPSVAGLLLEREWAELKTALRDPNRPLVSVIGGAKIVDKMPLLRQLLRRSDSMIIGGALANNFFVSLGLPVGASVWQPEADAETSEIITAARSRYGGKLKQHFLLPVDVAVSRNGNPKMARHNVARTQVAANNCIYDIGPKTINRVTEVIAKAGTVIWNGTMGLSSYENFSHGSARIAMTLAENPQIKSIILGGDTVDFVRRWDVLDGGSFGYLSTGGGAALALLAGKRLPGLDALLDR